MRLMNNLKVAPKLIGSFGVVIALMVTVALVVFSSIRHMTESSKWVNHTYEVIRTAESVGTAMINMETGQRGFMVTGRDEYLEPYNLGKSEFSKLLKQGQSLTSDNPNQADRWKRVNDLKKRWLAEAAEPEIAKRREVTQGFAAIVNFKKISSRIVGKEIFDNLRGALAKLEKTLNKNRAGQHIVTRLTLDLVNMETGQRGFLLSGKEASLEPYVEGLKSFNRNQQALRNTAAFNRSNERALKAVEKLMLAWRKQAAEPEISARREVNKYSMTMDNISTQMENGPGKQIMDTLRASLSEIIAEEEALIVKRAKEQTDTSSFASYFSLFGTIIAAIAGLALATVIARGILKPINETNRILKDIAEGDGDLTIRVPVASNDEIGELAINFNTFIAKLQSIIGDIAQVTSQLSAASEQTATIMQQTNAGVEKQKSETATVASAISQMNSAVHEVSSNAASASDAANGADQESLEGQKTVKKTVQSISDLAQEIEASSNVIEKLKQDSHNIGAVLDVIKSIAEQTNLLALNAAIEAARAGESGRGFAVVADEVRTLAKRTQESTEEIEQLISNLQTGAEQSVKVMNTSREQANASVINATQAGGSLDAITQSVETINQMNTQIATASEEQSAVSLEIQRNIDNIQAIANETALGSAQTSQASEEVANLGRQLNSMVNQFRI